MQHECKVVIDGLRFPLAVNIRRKTCPGWPCQSRALGIIPSRICCRHGAVTLGLASMCPGQVWEDSFSGASIPAVRKRGRASLYQC